MSEEFKRGVLASIKIIQNRGTVDDLRRLLRNQSASFKEETATVRRGPQRDVGRNTPGCALSSVPDPFRVEKRIIYEYLESEEFKKEYVRREDLLEAIKNSRLGHLAKMEDDDDNPFAGERWLGDHRRYDAYKRGQENPSPETVKKIEDKLREGLVEAMRMYAQDVGLLDPTYADIIQIIRTHGLKEE